MAYQISKIFRNFITLLQVVFNTQPVIKFQIVTIGVFTIKNLGRKAGVFSFIFIPFFLLKNGNTQTVSINFLTPNPQKLCTNKSFTN